MTSSMKTLSLGLRDRRNSDLSGKTVDLPAWMLKIPDEFWYSFLRLYQEGINCFWPVPAKWGYWRVNKDRTDLELCYLPSEANAASHYFGLVSGRGIAFFVTKRDYDDRIRAILSDSP